MSRRSGVVLSAVLATAALAGCASGRDWPGEALAPADALGHGHDRLALEVAAATRPVAMRPWDAAVVSRASGSDGVIVDEALPSPRAYRLDTGDRLRIFVYGQPNLSRLYIVDQSGRISVPLIGNLGARGLTTVQLEGAIRARLSQGLVRDPQVTVDVQQNRPFFILGEVRAPGQYPYVTGMTVEQAVAIAGGYGDRANERRARLTRRSGSVNDVLEVPPHTEIEPGDTIYVHERFF